jgi:hypothetical protein
MNLKPETLNRYQSYLRWARSILKGLAAVGGTPSQFIFWKRQC